jgi:hypothetical protein
MVYRFSRCLLGVLALLVLFAAPARAHTATVNIWATCACDYTVDISGNTGEGPGNVTLTYSFKVTSNGTTFTETKTFTMTADDAGNFSLRLGGIKLPGACGDTTDFSNGNVFLVFNNGGPETAGLTLNLPPTLFCGQPPPPPPGKTFDIGPSSMEGHLFIRPGDWISGGYSFKFVKAGHPDSTVTVTSTLTMPFKCSGGSTGQFTINLGTQNIAVPAGNTDWQPTGDANSVLSWAGSAQAPDGCGDGSAMDNSKGAIFESTVSQNPDNGALLNWRFKYRDPNAKGKGNVNCLDTSDPRRAKADVCGASWSGTITDP